MDEILVGIIGGSLATIFATIAPKLFDYWLSGRKEKREFRRRRTEKAVAEIEELIDEVGRRYELCVNLKGFEEKAAAYTKMRETEDQLIGKYNKYPKIGTAARDTLHWCKIVADCEQKRDEVVQVKKELTEKYEAFILACDKHIDKMI